MNRNDQNATVSKVPVSALLLTKKVLSQDQLVASSQRPMDTLEVRGEKPLEFDSMVLALRKLRRTYSAMLTEPAGEDGWVSPESLTAPRNSDMRELQPRATGERKTSPGSAKSAEEDGAGVQAFAAALGPHQG